jgi:glucose-1-phosphate adenylyltransferase
MKSSTGNLPPSQIRNAEINSSLICEGTVIQSAKINRSIIGPQSEIGYGSHIDSSYIFGSFDSIAHASSIGHDCLIQKAIIDNGVTIGNGVKLINQHGLEYFDHASIAIRDGIIIVKQGACLPDNFII